MKKRQAKSPNLYRGLNTYHTQQAKFAAKLRRATDASRCKRSANFGRVGGKVRRAVGFVSAQLRRTNHRLTKCKAIAEKGKGKRGNGRAAFKRAASAQNMASRKAGFWRWGGRWWSVFGGTLFRAGFPGAQIATPSPTFGRDRRTTGHASLVWRNPAPPHLEPRDFAPRTACRARPRS